jgi:hypothetical protein
MMDDGSTPEMRYVKSQIKFLAQEAHGLELHIDGNYEVFSEFIWDLEGSLHWADKRLDCYEKSMIHLLECHIPEPTFRYFQLPPDCTSKSCKLYSSTPPPIQPFFFGLSPQSFHPAQEGSIGSLPNWRPATPTPEVVASVRGGFEGFEIGSRSGSSPLLLIEQSSSTSLPSPHQPPPPSPSPQVGTSQENIWTTSSVGWILYCLLLDKRLKLSMQESLAEGSLTPLQSTCWLQLRKMMRKAFGKICRELSGRLEKR